MSEYLFVGGPLHGQIHDYCNNECIEPNGSTELIVSINEETSIYERLAYFPLWKGPQYVVAVFPGASELIQETIEQTGYRPVTV